MKPNIKWSGNNAILLIAAGIYVAFGAVAGYTTVNAVLLVLLGVERYRFDRSRLSIILIALGTLLLILNQFVLFIIVILASLAIYYFRARPNDFSSYINKHRLYLNMRQEEESWVLKSMSYWHAVGEVRMDISLAVLEEKETTIVLQGLVGDIDLTIPEDCGLAVEASVLLGQIGFKQVKEGGVFHRLSWRSPNYEQCEQQINLQLFYVVGDIKIRTV